MTVHTLQLVDGELFYRGVSIEIVGDDPPDNAPSYYLELYSNDNKKSLPNAQTLQEAVEIIDNALGVPSE